MIGGSAGSHEALQEVVRSFNPATEAALLVTIHTPSVRESALAALIRGWTTMPVVVPREPQTIRRGHVYLAAPD